MNQVAALISKQENKFVCSIVAKFESSPEIYQNDTYHDTLFDALLAALFYENVNITLDAYCDAIAYLGIKAIHGKQRNSIQ